VTEIRSATMICVNVESRDRAPTHVLTHRERVTASSIKRTLRITAGDGKSGRNVRLFFPIVPEAYFVPEGFGWREAA
jgi:hypothetical protein